MRKYIFFIFTIISILQNNNLISCPCEFSCDDERPFFEQYEIEENAINTQEKDKKS